MDKWIIGWLWLSCAIACGINYWNFEKEEKGFIHIMVVIIIAIIGPPLSALFIFGHILDWMAKREDA